MSLTITVYDVVFTNNTSGGITNTVTNITTTVASGGTYSNSIPMARSIVYDPGLTSNNTFGSNTRYVSATLTDAGGHGVLSIKLNNTSPSTPPLNASAVGVSVPPQAGGNIQATASIVIKGTPTTAHAQTTSTSPLVQKAENFTFITDGDETAAGKTTITHGATSGVSYAVSTNALGTPTARGNAASSVSSNIVLEIIATGK